MKKLSQASLKNPRIKKEYKAVKDLLKEKGFSSRFQIN